MKSNVLSIVLDVINRMVYRDLKELKSSPGKTYPKGLLQLNAMCLADIFSDDSNFRSYITIHALITEVPWVSCLYMMSLTKRPSTVTSHLLSSFILDIDVLKFMSSCIVVS